MKNYIPLLFVSLFAIGCGGNDNEKLNSLANSATKCDEVSISNPNYSWYLKGKDVARTTRLMEINNRVFGKNEKVPTNCGEAKEFAIKNAGSMKFATNTPIGFPENEEEYGGCWCKGFNDGLAEK